MYCARDEHCQGFCFLPVDGTCLITHTDQDIVLGSLQATAEAATYFIDMKAGFVRKGDIGYKLVRQRVNHWVARNACWNMGTNMTLPKVQ
ncbi:hypothetical protein Pcinc_010665 [Petrolisthes cinctipes]|uniref:Uncharacterized protein n=1 Tax=Petrolisthes cinctipes TaxID=88211 RepID=A0AAE1KUC0_PETCI|nr:hypothetical protein Pcinc_010665 [Petrolisthes cinctipes]